MRPGYRAHSCSGSSLRQADPGRWAISEGKDQYTTKCFQEKDGIWIPLGFLALAAVVGVWVMASLLARLV